MLCPKMISVIAVVAGAHSGDQSAAYQIQCQHTEGQGGGLCQKSPRKAFPPKAIIPCKSVLAEKLTVYFPWSC